LENRLLEKVKEQRLVCDKYNTELVLPDPNLIVGVSMNLRENIDPVHGLRHPLEGNTTGWYLWSGEYSEDPDFFKPLHYHHLIDWRPDILKYLGLPPGWRFLYAANYEDVWYDDELLNI
jgi:hypothetical protein